MIAGYAYEPLLCDIWSCGVILFAMVCGYLPFENADTSLLYKKILSGDFQFPDYISEQVKRLIKGLLNTDPKTRYGVNSICRDPWFCGLIDPKYLHGIDISLPVLHRSHAAQPLDAGQSEVAEPNEDILHQLELCFKMSRDCCLQQVRDNKHSHITAAYYLALKRHQRALREGRFADTYALRPLPSKVPPPVDQVESTKATKLAEEINPVRARSRVPTLDLGQTKVAPNVARAAGFKYDIVPPTFRGPPGAPGHRHVPSKKSSPDEPGPLQNTSKACQGTLSYRMEEKSSATAGVEKLYQDKTRGPTREFKPPIPREGRSANHSKVEARSLVPKLQLGTKGQQGGVGTSRIYQRHTQGAAGPTKTKVPPMSSRVYTKPKIPTERAYIEQTERTKGNDVYHSSIKAALVKIKPASKDGRMAGGPRRSRAVHVPLTARPAPGVTETLGNVRGQLSVACTTDKDPRYVVREISKVLGSLQVSHRHTSTYSYSCNKNQVKFGIDVSQLQGESGTSVVGIKRLIGDLATFQSVASTIKARFPKRKVLTSDPQNAMNTTYPVFS